MMARHDAPRPHLAGDTSDLLIEERRKIAFLPSLACLLGERRALVLQQIHFLVARQGEAVAGGRRYVFKKWTAWKRDDFPWMNVHSIRAAFYDLRDSGLVDVAGVVGPQGEAGYAVNREALADLYARNPQAGCEPEDAGKGGVRKFRTPPNRNRLRARALRTPPCGFYSPPPAPASQGGCENPPPQGAECARAVQMELRESVNSEGDREGKEAAAAQARAREGVAAERAAPEPAAAAGAGAAEAMPPPPAPLPPSHAAAVAALVRAGFGVDDAHRLAAETGATERWVEWLHRKAAKAAAKRPGVDVRGYVVAGLRRRWVPQDPAQQPPPAPPSPAQRAAREQAERTAGEIRSRAEAAARVEGDRARIDRELGELSGEQLDAIWTEILPDVPEAILASVARRGGPRASWAAKYAIHDELRRRKRLHACPPPAAHGAGGPCVLAAGEEGTPNPERR